MNQFDLMTVRELMNNDPMSELEFYKAYKHTDLFKRRRAIIELRENFRVLVQRICDPVLDFILKVMIKLK